MCVGVPFVLPHSQLCPHQLGDLDKSPSKISVFPLANGIMLTLLQCCEDHTGKHTCKKLVNDSSKCYPNHQAYFPSHHPLTSTPLKGHILQLPSSLHPSLCHQQKQLFFPVVCISVQSIPAFQKTCLETRNCWRDDSVFGLRLCLDISKPVCRACTAKFCHSCSIWSVLPPHLPSPLPEAAAQPVSSLSFLVATQQIQ